MAIPPRSLFPPHKVSHCRCFFRFPKSFLLLAALGFCFTVFDGQAATGTVIAWGDNTYGQTNLPLGLTSIVSVTAGFRHTLALKTDGTVVSWGDNSIGQTNVPAGLNGVIGIAAGDYHSLALKSNGRVVAWGKNSSGQASVPVDLSNVVAIAGGTAHSLALKSDGKVVGWGDNSGQTSVPPELVNAVAIDGGWYHSLALKSDGTVVAWGANYYGQISVPLGLTNVVAIAAGADYSLALKSDGTVVTWGQNGGGLLNVPTNLTNVATIAAGFGHSLALKRDGTMTAWGNNFSGQSTVPAGLSNVVAIAGGEAHSVAIVNNGLPGIVRQPVSQTRYSGTSVAMSVGAVSASPLNYQWQLNGTNITGAIDASLSLTNVHPVNSGNYTVVVTNTFGATTSLNATMIVITTPPILLTQPTNLVVIPASNATFRGSATGPVPISYQWLFNGTPLIGATSAVLSIAHVKLADEGIYALAVSNEYGVVHSSNAFLNVVGNLAEALDAPDLVWTVGGNLPWFPQTLVTHDGAAAARSGAISQPTIHIADNGRRPGHADFLVEGFFGILL